MKYLLALLFTFLIMGCGILEMLFPIDNFPQRYIEREVTELELVGTWHITPDSESRIKTYFEQTQKDDLHSGDIKSPWKTFILNKDGSCQISLENSWDVENKLITESDALPTCKWEINMIGGYDRELSSKQVPGLVMHFEHFNKQENMHYLYDSESFIVEENSELVLWSFVGDLTRVGYQDFKKIR